MKEVYDIIIEKLERDKLKFASEIYEVIDNIDYDDISRIRYYKAKANKDYAEDLIIFFKEVRDNL